jgi:DNA-directed RNA polymerase specialized sigma24 family protein
MDPEKTNTANNGLEWMLQNTSVDDSSLAAALVTSYYQQIYSLAYHLLGKQPGSAGKAAQEAIAVAVRERHHLSIETSLRAWLFAYIYRRCRQVNARPFVKSVNLPFFPRSKPYRIFYLDDGLEDLPSKYAIALALNDVYGFSLSEAALVQEISPNTARERLIASRAAAYHHFYPQKLNPMDHMGYIDQLYRGAENLDLAESGEKQDHLAACPVCQAYAERLPDLERRLASAADGASQQVPIQDLEAASQAVLGQIRLSQNSRRSSLPFKEIGLVGAIVVTLVLFGNWLELFTPYDASPMQTPQLTAPPALTPTPGPLSPILLEGEEGNDYFYYNYPVHEVETLETLSEKTGLTQDEIRFLNQLEPGRSTTFSYGREVRLVAFRDRGWFDPPPRSTNRLLSPPLTASSSVEEVLERVRESEAYWQTMWVEYVYLLSPISGVLAPPDIIYFFQVWQAGPDRGVMAASGFGEEGFVVNFKVGEWSFLREDGKYRAMWGSPERGTIASLYGADLTTAFGIIEFQIGKSEVIAGREAVSLTGVLDDGQLEIWIDALTGVNLGFGLTGLFDEGATLRFAVNRVEYDIQLPPNLFYPPTSPVQSLSASYRGEPVQDPSSIPIDWSNFPMPPYIETLLSPPADLELARTSIFFQKLDSASSVFEVFADEYYLGSLEFPHNIRGCQRSPEGSHVLLTTITHVFFGEGIEHYLLNLLTLEQTKILETSYGTAKFAFSPDSSRLAAVNCGYPCRVNLYDIETGESRQLGRNYHFSHVQNLAWSPDGGEIAILLNENPSYGQIVVFEVESGEEIFTSSYHGANITILTPGSPSEDWEVPFPGDEIIHRCDQPVIP